ncbi:hypothetical protein AB6A23_12730 [Paenibacillus tarimensis]
MGNHNEEIKNIPMLPPSVRTVEIQEDTRKPKLSMKYLQELILELQHENRVLAERLEELERSMSEDRLLQHETAAAMEVTGPETDSIPEPFSITGLEESQPQFEMLITAVLEHSPDEIDAEQTSESDSAILMESSVKDNRSRLQYQLELSTPVLTPRSLRHPSRKRTFWSMFRFRTS